MPSDGDPEIGSTDNLQNKVENPGVVVEAEHGIEITILISMVKVVATARCHDPALALLEISPVLPQQRPVSSQNLLREIHIQIPPTTNLGIDTKSGCIQAGQKIILTGLGLIQQGADGVLQFSGNPQHEPFNNISSHELFLELLQRILMDDAISAAVAGPRSKGR
jgi:hypothetical protein